MGETFEYSAKKGSGLEQRVSVLFTRAGFKTELNKRMDDGTGTKAEIDVYATSPEGETLVVECKHREVMASTVSKDDFLKLTSRVNSFHLGDIGLLICDGQINDRFQAFEDKGIYFWDARDLLKAEGLEGEELKSFIYDYLGLTQVDRSEIVKGKAMSGAKKIGFMIASALFLLVALSGLALILFIIFPEAVGKLIAYTLFGGLMLFLVGMFIFFKYMLDELQDKPKKRKKRKRRGRR